jgi:hypothetical protein
VDGVKLDEAILFQLKAAHALDDWQEKLIMTDEPEEEAEGQ